ncbi:hypothetical protein ABIB75_002993 [Bradyrhizobium sp. GM2.2]
MAAAPARNVESAFPLYGLRTFTDVNLAREVVVCLGILLLGARYDPVELKLPRADRIIGRQDRHVYRVLRQRLNRSPARGCDR